MIDQLGVEVPLRVHLLEKLVEAHIVVDERLDVGVVWHEDKLSATGRHRRLSNHLLCDDVAILQRDRFSLAQA